MARPFFAALCALCLLVLSVSAARSAEIHEAAQEGNLARVQEIVAADAAQLEAEDDGGITPLHSAAIGGSEDVIEFLLSQGAGVDAVDDYDDTPLHFTAYAGKMGALQILCRHGARVNAATLIGQVALHFAARNASLEMVKYLVENGADVNRKDTYGRGSLFFARVGGNEDVMAYLRDRGAVDDFQMGEAITQELAPGLTQITVPFANRTNAVALVGADGVLLVDTGMTATAAPLTAALARLGRGPVRTIINTHLHNDHTGANAGVDSTATVISFESLEKLKTEGALSLSAEGPAGPSGKSLPAYYTLAFDGHPVRIIPTPDMHSASDVLVVFPEFNVVCMGSLLISEGFPGIGGGAVDRYVEFLDTVLDVFPPQTRFVGGHGRTLDRAGLREYRNMVVDSVRAIRAEMAKRESLAEVIAADPTAPWSRYGECPFLPYITSKLWIKTVYRSADGGQDRD